MISISFLNLNAPILYQYFSYTRAYPFEQPVTNIRVDVHSTFSLKHIDDNNPFVIHWRCNRRQIPQTAHIQDGQRREYYERYSAEEQEKRNHGDARFLSSRGWCSWYFLRWIIDLPLSFLRKRSTDCEQTGRSLSSASADPIYVFRLLFIGSANPLFVFISVKLFRVLLLTSSAYLMGARLFARFASFSFFSHSCRSIASARFSSFYCSSSARSSLLDFSSSRTVPMHSMMRLAYSWLEARLSSSSRSMDLNISIWRRATSRSFLRRSFSILSCWISLALRSMLMLTWFLILPALTAYCSVESVSSRQSACGLRQAMRQVRQFPPNAFFRIEVSLASRYGTYCSFPLLARSSSDRITFRRKNSDLLISIAYLLSRPTGLNTRSDPARSTKQALRTRQLCSSSSSSMLIMKMVCDLLEKSCILLQAMTLFLLPKLHSRSISSEVAHSFSLRSQMMNSRSISHRMRSPRFSLKSATSMSVIRSLQSWMKEHLMTAEEVLLAQMSETAAEMMPWLLASPSKAKVLPEPVCPQVRTAVLYPSTNFPTSVWIWQLLQIDSVLLFASWIMSTWMRFDSSPGSFTMTSFVELSADTMLLCASDGFIFTPIRIEAFFIILLQVYHGKQHRQQNYHLISRSECRLLVTSSIFHDIRCENSSISLRLQSMWRLAALQRAGEDLKVTSSET